MEASAPINVAARLLQDMGMATWDESTQIKYLNLAIKAVVDQRPDANPVTGLVPLVAGTVQNLPQGALFPLKFVRNMGTGNNPGRAITLTDEAAIASHLPYWRTFPASSEVRQVVSDQKRPTVFEIFPPQPTGTSQKIEVVYSQYPDAVATLTDTFPLGDQFEEACSNYIVHLALSEETTIPNALNKSTMFYNKFLQGLGIQRAAETENRKGN